ncbi:hypothetical protein [Prevotella sp. P6B1]|uniref:hypothetical protein n=1 Tax=Prevotella sp. P6B1 TaxID=1410613 RepID=UPI0012DD694E|nr:hypothetical protein [Prevotella sp. P6B1]
MLLLGVMLLVGAGCAKDVPQSSVDMQYFYAESSALHTVAADSIQRFAVKVETYAQQNPQAKADPLWPEIIDNIKSAAQGANIHFVITIDTEWEGEIEIYF